MAGVPPGAARVHAIAGILSLLGRLLDEAFSLSEASNNREGGSLAYRKLSARVRQTVGRNEELALFDHEEDAERCGQMNNPGNWDEVRALHQPVSIALFVLLVTNAASLLRRCADASINARPWSRRSSRSSAGMGSVR